MRFEYFMVFVTCRFFAWTSYLAIYRLRRKDVLTILIRFDQNRARIRDLRAPLFVLFQGCHLWPGPSRFESHMTDCQVWPPGDCP